MKEFAVVGRPNSGKTLFALNFAGFLNCKAVDITFRACDNSLHCRHFTLADAKRELCGPSVHKTLNVQSLLLKIPLGKNAVAFKLTDTCGVTENIDERDCVRRGMAQTLSLVRASDFLIHILDLTVVNESFLQRETNIDRDIYQYGIARNRYLLLANKIDLPQAKDILPKIHTSFQQTKIYPISALCCQGFSAVKEYVASNV